MRALWSLPRLRKHDLEKVSYSFDEPEHALGKKDILSAEKDACERLLKYASDEFEKKAVEKELSELRIT